MRSTSKIFRACLMVLVLICGLVATRSAQTYTATVTGTITDPSGAAVQNAKVAAVNQGTKLEHTAQSNDSGVYTIPFLPVGNYVLNVEAQGFKKLVSNQVTLEVNQTARIDLQLQIGDYTEVVNVQDVTAVLQTESVTVGQVVTGNTITSLPLNGRSFQQLTLLVPGAISPNAAGFTSPSPFDGGDRRPFVNGNREQGNQFLLDGVTIDETIDNRIGYKPNIDAIAEFKVETSNSSAEFGNVTGATVNATIKSGTNEFHGSAFEFLRNDALDAQSWANNRNNVPDKPKLRQNIFGGTLGGPIIKNELFFFMDYQGVIQRTGGGSSIRVAPLSWRQGDLSTLSPFIRDPLKPQSQLCQATPLIPTPGVNYQEACFPGSIIPADRIVNPVALSLLPNTTLYPLPNRIEPTTGAGILDVITANSFNGNQFDVKLDARLSDKDNLSGRYSFGNFDFAGDQGSIPVIMTTKNFSRPQNLALNWIHSFNPSLINEARFGYNRAVFIGGAFDWAGIGDLNAALGIPGGQAIPGLSEITLGSVGAPPPGLGIPLDNIGARATDEDNVTNTFQYGDILSITRGRHFFKMGGQWLRYQQNRFYAGNNGLLGFFSYGTTFTGFNFSDFLLDQLNQKGLGAAAGSNKGTWGHRQNRIGLFFQDDFRVRNNLSLNLGIRWEYTSPLVEVVDRQANFVMFSGVQQLAGVDGNSRALYDPFHKGFEPRIGIAWTPSRLDGKFVIRAGYGITQFMEGTGSNLRLPLNTPFFAEADVSYDLGTGPGTITDGFTDIIVRDTPFGLIRVWEPNIRPQFTQQWNLSLEYQATNSTSVTAAYIGQNASHLVAPTDFNQPLPGVGDPSIWVPFQQRRPLFGPLPDVTQVSGTASWAIARYNALQASVRQRLSRGLELLGSYTLSKTLTDNLGYYGSAGVADQGAYSGNQYNQRGYNYGPAFFDARHNFVVAGSYELPVGRGKTWGNNWNPVVNAFLGGWVINSLISAHSGFPITVTTTDNTLQNPRGPARPDLIGEPRLFPSIPDCYAFNPRNSFCPVDAIEAFAAPPLGVFGSAGVGILRASSFFNWDFGLGKKFYVSESKFFDFRAEFFNFTNTPSFNPPDSQWTPTATTFGQITSTISNSRIIEFALKFQF